MLSFFDYLFPCNRMPSPFTINLHILALLPFCSSLYFPPGAFFFGCNCFIHVLDLNDNYLCRAINVFSLLSFLGYFRNLKGQSIMILLHIVFLLVRCHFRVRFLFLLRKGTSGALIFFQFKEKSHLPMLIHVYLFISKTSTTSEVVQLHYHSSSSSSSSILEKITCSSHTSHLLQPGSHYISRSPPPAAVSLVLAIGRRHCA